MTIININYKLEWFNWFCNQKKESLIYSDYYKKIISLSDTPLCIANDDEKAKKLFTVVPNPLIIYDYQNSIDISKRNMYEIIPGDTFQKIHFDIDISDILIDDFNEDKFVNELVDTLKGYIKIELNLEKDVLIFTSHGKNKKSYHIIIDNYCLKDCNESKKLINLMLIKNPYLNLYIDKSIYTRNRQFRLYGNSKLNDVLRIKILKREWKYYDRVIRYYETNEEKIFLNSLVTNVENCKDLCLFGVQDDDKLIETKDIKINNSIIDQINRVYKIKFNCDKVPYEIVDVRGNLIITKRIAPSKCFFHNDKVHEHENPFFVICKDGTLKYSCRRNDFVAVVIGNIKLDDNKIIVDDKIDLKKIESKRIEEEIKEEVKTKEECDDLIERAIRNHIKVKSNKKIIKDKDFFIERKKILMDLRE